MTKNETIIAANFFIDTPSDVALPAYEHMHRKICADGIANEKINLNGR
jgi:hypothetical protein